MAMPQDASYARLSGQVSEARRGTVASEDRQWLKGLFSGRFPDLGKLVAVAAIALLRGRRGRFLLRRLTIGSVVFVYDCLAIVEVIVGFLVVAQVAAKVLPLFTFTNTQSGRRSATVNLAASISNDGDRTGPNSARRQNENIQNHLQQLAMAAAEAETANSGAALTGAGQAKSNPGCNDFSTTVRAEHQKRHNQLKEWPHTSLQESEKSVVIHFLLPVYVCDLTFWNDIQITVPSSSPLPSTVAGKYRSNTTYHPSTSAAALVCQIELRMSMEMNRDLIAGRTQNYRNPCKDCSTGSHSVGKRRFKCSFLDCRPDGQLDVQKCTFHGGRKLTIQGPNDGLNFIFETALEPTLAGPRGNAAAFKQQATFTLLSQTSRPISKSAKQQEQSSKVDRGVILEKPHGRYRSALLAFFRRNNTAHSALATISKCSVETLCPLEDRRIITKDWPEIPTASPP